MYEQLTKLKSEKKLIAIYTNENNGEAFSVGYICNLEQDKALLLNVGVHGEYDGYSMMYIDDIFRIECDSKYLDKMSKLMSFLPDEKIAQFNANDILLFLIEKAITGNKILAIQYNGDGEIKGYVKKINSILSVVEIDEYGYEDGENMIPIDNISKIVLDDVECRDLEKLYTVNKNHKK